MGGMIWHLLYTLLSTNVIGSVGMLRDRTAVTNRVRRHRRDILSSIGDEIADYAVVNVDPKQREPESLPSFELRDQRTYISDVISRPTLPKYS